MEALAHGGKSVELMQALWGDGCSRVLWKLVKFWSLWRPSEELVGSLCGPGARGACEGLVGPSRGPLQLSLAQVEPERTGESQRAWCS